VTKQKPAWKKLLLQALKTTPITEPNGTLRRWLMARHYIYHALQNAGIENRSPFSLRQILLIQWRSRGQAEQIKSLSIEALQQLPQPANSFSQHTPLLVWLLVAGGLLASLMPKTATTYLTAQPKASILTIHTLPWGDQEAEQTELPLVSDYLSAAFETVEFPANDPVQSLAGAGWIVRQPDSAYTLQLLSVSRRSNLQQFCRKFNICGQSAIYSTRINGKTITRLLYGRYRNHRAAKLARSRLPKGLSGWARQFSQIKSEL